MTPDGTRSFDAMSSRTGVMLKQLTELSKQSAAVVTQQTELERLSQQNDMLYQRYIEEKEQRILLEIDLLTRTGNSSCNGVVPSPTLLRGSPDLPKNRSRPHWTSGPESSCLSGHGDRGAALITSDEHGGDTGGAVHPHQMDSNLRVTSRAGVGGHTCGEGSPEESSGVSMSTYDTTRGAMPSCSRGQHDRFPFLTPPQALSASHSRDYFVKLALETGSAEDMQAARDYVKGRTQSERLSVGQSCDLDEHGDLLPEADQRFVHVETSLHAAVSTLVPLCASSSSLGGGEENENQIGDVRGHPGDGLKELHYEQLEEDYGPMRGRASSQLSGHFTDASSIRMQSNHSACPGEVSRSSSARSLGLARDFRAKSLSGTSARLLQQSRGRYLKDDGTSTAAVRDESENSPRSKVANHRLLDDVQEKVAANSRAELARAEMQPPPLSPNIAETRSKPDAENLETWRPHQSLTQKWHWQPQQEEEERSRIQLAVTTSPLLEIPPEAEEEDEEVDLDEDNDGTSTVCHRQLIASLELLESRQQVRRSNDRIEDEGEDGDGEMSLLDHSVVSPASLCEDCDEPHLASSIEEAVFAFDHVEDVEKCFPAKANAFATEVVASSKSSAFGLSAGVGVAADAVVATCFDANEAENSLNKYKDNADTDRAPQQPPQGDCATIETNEEYFPERRQAGLPLNAVPEEEEEAAVLNEVAGLTSPGGTDVEGSFRFDPNLLLPREPSAARNIDPPESVDYDVLGELSVTGVSAHVEFIVDDFPPHLADTKEENVKNDIIQERKNDDQHYGDAFGGTDVETAHGIGENTGLKKEGETKQGAKSGDLLLPRSGAAEDAPLISPITGGLRSSSSTRLSAIPGSRKNGAMSPLFFSKLGRSPQKFMRARNSFNASLLRTEESVRASYVDSERSVLANLPSSANASVLSVVDEELPSPHSHEGFSEMSTRRLAPSRSRGLLQERNRPPPAHRYNVIAKSMDASLLAACAGRWGTADSGKRLASLQQLAASNSVDLGSLDACFPRLPAGHQDHDNSSNFPVPPPMLFGTSPVLGALETPSKVCDVIPFEPDAIFEEENAATSGMPLALPEEESVLPETPYSAQSSVVRFHDVDLMSYSGGFLLKDGRVVAESGGAETSSSRALEPENDTSEQIKRAEHTAAPRKEACADDGTQADANDHDRRLIAASSNSPPQALPEMQTNKSEAISSLGESLHPVVCSDAWSSSSREEEEWSDAVAVGREEERDEGREDPSYNEDVEDGHSLGTSHKCDVLHGNSSPTDIGRAGDIDFMTSGAEKQKMSSATRDSNGAQRVHSTTNGASQTTDKSKTSTLMSGKASTLMSGKERTAQDMRHALSAASGLDNSLKEDLMQFLKELTEEDRAGLSLEEAELAEESQLAGNLGTGDPSEKDDSAVLRNQVIDEENLQQQKHPQERCREEEDRSKSSFAESESAEQSTTARVLSYTSTKFLHREPKRSILVSVEDMLRQMSRNETTSKEQTVSDSSLMQSNVSHNNSMLRDAEKWSEMRLGRCEEHDRDGEELSRLEKHESIQESIDAGEHQHNLPEEDNIIVSEQEGTTTSSGRYNTAREADDGNDFIEDTGDVEMREVEEDMNVWEHDHGKVAAPFGEHAITSACSQTREDGRGFSADTPLKGGGNKKREYIQTLGGDSVDASGSCENLLCTNDLVLAPMSSADESGLQMRYAFAPFGRVAATASSSRPADRGVAKTVLTPVWRQRNAGPTSRSKERDNVKVENDVDEDGLLQQGIEEEDRKWKKNPKGQGHHHDPFIVRREQNRLKLSPDNKLATMSLLCEEESGVDVLRSGDRSAAKADSLRSSFTRLQESLLGPSPADLAVEKVGPEENEIDCHGAASTSKKHASDADSHSTLERYSSRTSAGAASASAHGVIDSGTERTNTLPVSLDACRPQKAGVEDRMVAVTDHGEASHTPPTVGEAPLPISASERSPANKNRGAARHQKMAWLHRDSLVEVPLSEILLASTQLQDRDLSGTSTLIAASTASSRAAVSTEVPSPEMFGTGVDSPTNPRNKNEDHAPVRVLPTSTLQCRESSVYPLEIEEAEYRRCTRRVDDEPHHRRRAEANNCPKEDECCRDEDDSTHARDCARFSSGHAKKTLEDAMAVASYADQSYPESCPDSDGIGVEASDMYRSVEAEIGTTTEEDDYMPAALAGRYYDMKEDADEEEEYGDAGLCVAQGEWASVSSIQESWTTLQQARMSKPRNPSASLEFSRSILQRLDNLLEGGINI
ncbi:unnamed protein product [Amoebophrya sp. A25]|nr:unnamed protein product [Amoebophrya sp. A25]|eukprot:GSA25T00005420001.1